MPKIKVGTMTVNYEQEGSGEPLILIPYLAVDHACYAFQVAEYSKHFNCISIDLRGTGETDSPAGAYSTETLADDVADLMYALGLPAAHISGLSLGAAVGAWLAAKHPAMVKSLSLHSGWPRSDAFVKAVVESWRAMARGSSVAETLIRGIFPWCFTPEMYAARPEYVQMLTDFVLSRPAQSVQSFLQQSNAVMAHDAQPQLARITAPTQITFGRYDAVTSTRFADPMRHAIRNSELLIFEGCSHAPIYEKVEEFNARTMGFLKSHAGVGAARA